MAGKISTTLLCPPVNPKSNSKYAYVFISCNVLTIFFYILSYLTQNFHPSLHQFLFLTPFLISVFLYIHLIYYTTYIYNIYVYVCKCVYYVCLSLCIYIYQTHIFTLCSIYKLCIYPNSWPLVFLFVLHLSEFNSEDFCCI